MNSEHTYLVRRCGWGRSPNFLQRHKARRTRKWAAYHKQTGINLAFQTQRGYTRTPTLTERCGTALQPRPVCVCTFQNKQVGQTELYPNWCNNNNKNFQINSQNWQIATTGVDGSWSDELQLCSEDNPSCAFGLTMNKYSGNYGRCHWMLAD